MTNENFYFKLRKKILDYGKREGKNNLWLKYLFLAPDFFYLLCKLATEEALNSESKLKVSMAITYFINPLDFIPDFFISVGYLDDIVVAAYVISGVLKYVSADVINEHWPAKRDIVEVVNDINKAAESIVAGDVLDKIMSIFGDKVR